MSLVTAAVAAADDEDTGLPGGARATPPACVREGEGGEGTRGLPDSKQPWKAVLPVLPACVSGEREGGLTVNNPGQCCLCLMLAGRPSLRACRL